MPTITCRIGPTLHERVLAECDSRDVKLSDILREFLERWVDHLDDARAAGSTYTPGASAATTDVKRVAGEPKPIGWTASGEPVYGKTGPLQLPPKGGKK